MTDGPLILDIPGALPGQLLTPAGSHDLLEGTILPAYIPRCRWFSGKAREPRRFRVRDMVPIADIPGPAQATLVDVEYAEGPNDTWLLPLQVLSGEEAGALVSAHPGAVLARFDDGIICDALHDAAFREALYSLMAGKEKRPGGRGYIEADSGPALRGKAAPPSKVHAVEQSNSSIIYGETVFLKLYRRIEAGMNPDAEILRFLSQRGFAHVPPYAGSVEYRESNGHGHVLALATGLVPNHGDAWSFTLRELTRWFAALWAEDQTGARQIEEESLARVAQLGTRTGELHLALAAQTGDPDFAPEPLAAADAKGLADNILSSADQIARLITARLDDLPSPELGHRFLAAEATIRSHAAALLAKPFTTAKTRTHGDYHLGQVLETGGDFVIIDFEGEPLRSLASRRGKRSPFRDVAGMMRSFDYAAHAALESQAPHRAVLAPQASQWPARAQRAFLDAWRNTTIGALFRSATSEEEERLLDAFLLEKALYEVIYEISNRPTWLHIPLHGVLGLVER